MRGRWRAVTLALLVLAATGCSPIDRSARRLDPSTGRPELVLALCPDEHVEKVSLRLAKVEGASYDVGSLLWQIEAVRPSRRDSFVVGEVPAGFVERHPLRGPVPPSSVLVANTSGGISGGLVQLDQLDDRLRADSGPTTMSELRSAARHGCSSNPFAGVGSIVWPFTGFLVICLATAAYFLRKSRGVAQA